ncbi:MAG: hypothetical protein M3R38_23155 [Actinomycetota bacterium]|nr:hypothetical protein [Actinomycetota bacterium]
MTLLLSLDRYADEEVAAAGPEAVAETIIATHDADHILLGLSLINHYLGDRRARDAVFKDYRRTLRPSLRERFDSAVEEAREKTGGDPMICSRQGVLLAMRAVLEAYPEGKSSIEGEMSLRSVILLVHALSSRLGASDTALDEDTTTFGGAPAGLVMELVRNGLLYEQDDPICVMDRALSLYQDHASGVHKVGNLRASPREILSEALGGMSFEEFFSLGYALWMLAVGRDPNDPESGPTTPAKLTGLAVPDDRREAFLERVSATPEWYASEFRGEPDDESEGEPGDGCDEEPDGERSEYNFLPIQNRPIVRVGDHLLVLDETYLLQKFTATGLHYAAHDYEKYVRKDEKDRERWSGAYGEMLEAMVEERLRTLAPTLIGSRGRRKSFYTEEDIWEAYGEGAKKGKKKAIDAVVDYGDYVVLFEVYSGQPTLGTRIEGDPEAFGKDTKKLVLDKAKQLHATAEHLIADQAALTGVPAPPGRKIVPVVILAGGSYPADAVSRGRVDELLAERGLLQRPGVVEPLCVLNLGELEMLESLVEAGAKPGPVLSRWKGSDLRNAPFWNHVLREVNPNLGRPTRVGRRVAEAIQEAVVGLGGGALLQEEP